ncbi:MAG: adenosine deaminase [Elusimicrobia bacterium]|nr:adenosine deaminase [Elusimicrobiota bacterium]
MDARAAFIAALPKVENHLHLDGALSTETVKRLAERVPGSPLRGLSAAEIRRKVVVKTPRAALAEVLAAFDAFYPLLKSAQAVELAAYEAAREARRQNVLYHELRFAPILQEAPGFAAADALDAALRGAAAGERDFGVGAGVIVCLLRPFSIVSREKNAELARLAVDYAGRGVVGLDVADVGPGDEALASYGEWFRAARAAGLGLTAHAGEAPRGRELEDALALGVDRIGHGVRLRERPDLAAEVARRGLPVEVNLTSNLRTGAVASYREHPARAWFDAGLKVTLSTDDPGVFGVDLNHEYGVLARELGFTDAELVAVSRNGIESLFLPEAAKAALRAEFDRRLKAPGPSAAR